jgi:hypothetical protein
VAVVVEAVSGPLPYLCLPVAVLLFPDGRLPSLRWRLALEAFVLIAALYVASELGQALGAVIGHTIRVDSGGALLALDHPPTVLWESAAAPAAQVADERSLRRRARAGRLRRRGRADKTVTAFAGRLQDAIDLDSVRDDLTGVVHQALEPAHLSVWVSRRDLGLSCLRRPRVEDLDAGAIEVRQVASGQCRPAGAANGGYESVETSERLPSPLAGTGNDRVLLSGCRIDRQDLLIKGPEGVVRGI